MDERLIDLLRADLEAAGYSTGAVEALLGPAADGARQRGVFAPARRVLAGRERSALATLVRAFLLGETVSDDELAGALPGLGAAGAAELGVVESNPTIDGRNMVMVVAPVKNKSEAKAEQNAVRAANKQAARDAKHHNSGSDAAEATTPAE